MNARTCRMVLWLGAAKLAMALAGCTDESDAMTEHPSRRTKPDDEETHASAAGARASEPSKGSAGATPEKEPSDPACGAGRFDSTFAAIQKVIFEGRSCNNDMCHGAAAMGGLDLRPDVAYKNLIEVKSTLGSQKRVVPGLPAESFLFNKLRAATEPDSVKIAGSAMPSGAPPLSREHLEVMHRWIEAGAPKQGSVGDNVTGKAETIAALLGSCLPEATPLEITPLPAPAANEGVQLAMAPLPLPAASEIDVCFAQYYDFSDVIPAEFQDAKEGVFFVNGQSIRQDPQSHHLTINRPDYGAEAVNDPSFGKWACRGGAQDGKTCDPLQPNGCGASPCASEVQDKPTCFGFGPSKKGDSLSGPNIFAASGTAQSHQPPRDGLYSKFPIRGLLYWNSHSFNLTTKDTKLHAWVNLYFAKDRRTELNFMVVADKLSIAAGTPPFTTKTYCSEWVAPRNSVLYSLLSHTHKRGRNFTVDLLDGKRIYQSALYSDPVNQLFDPPMRFDAADPVQRTLKYCAEFNNGVTKDGKPDLDLVTRRSTMPERTTCTPVACVAGKVGSACSDDDAACDSTAGAGDGWCDACPITAGATTENEMFVLNPAITKE